jgi:hypothetical protein
MQMAPPQKIMHFLHAAPMVPQAVMLVPDWHLPALSQQPILQFAELHDPPPEPELLPPLLPEEPVAHDPRLHVPPELTQFWQGPPPTPHAVSVVPAVQLPISQQPIAQLVASHAAPAALPPPPLPVELPAVAPLPLPPPLELPLLDPLSLPLLLPPPPVPLAAPPPFPLLSPLDDEPDDDDPDDERGALASP